MQLSQFDIPMIEERISQEIEKYMKNYWNVYNSHKGRMSSSNSGNLKKLQQCLYIALGGKRIKLDQLGHDVRGFMEHGKKPDWY